MGGSMVCIYEIVRAIHFPSYPLYLSIDLKGQSRQIVQRRHDGTRLNQSAWETAIDGIKTS